MAIDVVPGWMTQLEEEDVAFIKRFVLASGSLKQIAGEYGVTYPTVRLRLDRLIQKIELGEREDEDPYVALIKRLAVNDKLATVVLAINLGLWLAMLVGIVALQVFLSRRKAWWPGLIMPVCTLPGVLLVLPNVLLNALSMAENAGQTLISVLGSALCLLPTLVLLAVYFFCRRKDKHKRQLDKMNIQDL